jgi:hypothetical protein
MKAPSSTETSGVINTGPTCQGTLWPGEPQRGNKAPQGHLPTQRVQSERHQAGCTSEAEDRTRKEKAHRYSCTPLPISRLLAKHNIKIVHIPKKKNIL